MEGWLTDNISQDTIVDECYTCKKERDVNEDMQCKKCYDKGLVMCYDCSVVENYKDMNDIDDGDYKCDDCFQPLCVNCNEEVSEKGEYCSKSCYKEYYNEYYNE